MKKLVLLLSLALSLNGCKQKEAKTEPGTEKPQMMVSPANMAKSDCTIFNQMDSLPVPEKVAWLRAHQADICAPEYDTCRENKHKITEKEFSDAITAYWGTRTAKYTNIDLEHITSLTTDTEYQKFIRATADTNNDISLAAVTDFNTAYTQYSIPLFYSIKRINKLDGKAVISFTLAKIDGQTKIVFFIESIRQFYDMSGNPV